MDKQRFKAEQLSIFLENRAGRLSEVIHLLACAKINILAISLADTSDFGILRLIANDMAKAESILKEHGFTTGRTRVLVLAVNDEPGALDKTLALLSRHDINVEYMYVCAASQPGEAALVFRFDKLDEALEILDASDARIIPAARLYSS